MIESITIKKVTSYDETGIQINDLKKVNALLASIQSLIFRIELTERARLT